MWGSAQAEHRDEGVVYCPHLVGDQRSHSSTEPLDIHSTELLDEHARRIAGDDNLGVKTMLASYSAMSGRPAQPNEATSHRPGRRHRNVHQLLVADALGQREAVHITPLINASVERRPHLQPRSINMPPTQASTCGSSHAISDSWFAATTARALRHHRRLRRAARQLSRGGSRVAGARTQSATSSCIGPPVAWR